MGDDPEIFTGELSYANYVEMADADEKEYIEAHSSRDQRCFVVCLKNGAYKIIVPDSGQPSGFGVHGEKNDKIIRFGGLEIPLSA